jgi:hypothetical protein
MGYDEAYYWATHNGAELDLLLCKDGRRMGVECKRAHAPVLTPSMRIALTDLKLDRLYVLDPEKNLFVGKEGRGRPAGKIRERKTLTSARD